MSSDLVEHLKGYDLGCMIGKVFEIGETDDPLKPSYYNEFNIDFLREAGLLRGFCLGNAIKYIDRAGKKKGESEEKDLRKAIEYLKIFLGDER